MTFTINATKVSCERCGMNAQFNWDGHNVCGSGCYELINLANPEKRGFSLEHGIRTLIGTSHQALEDALGNVVKQEDSIKIPASTYSRYYPDSQTWVIELNKYHRDNLLWLFNVIGYPSGNEHMVEPFHFANTGDWNGEIPIMLAKPGGGLVIDKEDSPNNAAASLRSNIEFWLKSKK